MNNLEILKGASPRDILETAIESKTAGCISYLFNKKWHSAKILLKGMGANVLDIEIVSRKKMFPIPIKINHGVSILLKHEHIKLCFDTVILWIVPSMEPTESKAMMLAIPNQIKVIERRKHLRVNVPANLCIKVRMWHLYHVNNNEQVPPEHCWKCRLVDISPGGVRVIFNAAQRPDFKKGEVVGLQFAPMPPYEMPLIFDTTIVRYILPTDDKQYIYLGLQFAGLETSTEGRHILEKVYNAVEFYYEQNQYLPEQYESQKIKLDEGDINACF